jgi:predicted phage terminase large subunit-like protein
VTGPTLTAPSLTDLAPADLRALKRQLIDDLEHEDNERTRQHADAIRARCETFAGFVKEAWHVIEPGTPLRWNWHLDAMCAHLEAVSRKRISPWGIINVPPGSSKSTIVSVLWQAWEWGALGMRHLRYVSTSFEEENVKRDTRKCRDLIRSEWFRTLWPEVEMTRAGELSFANSDTGSREGVPFGSLTGKRGDRVVIDDPHSLKGSESETERNNTVRLFLEGGLNRTNDALTSAMIVVMQRLHENDLTGALLARNLGFWHLMIPMEFEPERRCSTPLVVEGGKNWIDPRSYLGELMDPGRFPQMAVDRQKEGGDYAWAGQYQQRPAPRGGGMFKVPEDWAVDRANGGRVVSAAPHGGQIVAGWDFAGSKRKTSPYTVRAKMTRVGGDFYIMHVARRRTDPTELDQMTTDVVRDDGYNTFQSMPQDPGQAGKSQKWSLAEKLAGYEFEITPETGAKETRAEPFAAMWGAGRVFLVRGDWNAEYIDELRSFPAGSYKDQVDASSRAFGKLVGADTLPPINAAPQLVGEGDYSSSRYADRDYPETDLPWGA